MSAFPLFGFDFWIVGHPRLHLASPHFRLEGESRVEVVFSFLQLTVNPLLLLLLEIAKSL
jgi:hypothetical protein